MATRTSILGPCLALWPSARVQLEVPSLWLLIMLTGNRPQVNQALTNNASEAILPQENQATNILIALAFRYCVLDSVRTYPNKTLNPSRLNAHSFRAWMVHTVHKMDCIPWTEILSSTIKVQSNDTNAKIIKRMRCASTAGSGDFIAFFRWVLHNTHTVAVLIKKRLQGSHTQLPIYQDAITESANCTVAFPPFPADSHLACQIVRQLLKDRGCTKFGGRCR